MLLGMMQEFREIRDKDLDLIFVKILHSWFQALERLGGVGLIHHVKQEENFGGWERCTFERTKVYF